MDSISLGPGIGLACESPGGPNQSSWRSFISSFLYCITRGAPGGGEAPNKRGRGPAIRCVAPNKYNIYVNITIILSKTKVFYPY